MPPEIVDSRTACICVSPRIHAVRQQSVSPNPSAMVVTANQSYLLSAELDAGESVVWYAQDSQPERQIGSGPSITVTPAEVTIYTAAVTGLCGTSRTAGVKLGPCADTVITLQPVSASVAMAGPNSVSVSAHVEASGTPTSTYHWYEGESGDLSHPIPESSSPGLSAIGNNVTLAGPAAATERVWARATSSCGYADSLAVTLAITSCAPPILGGVAYGGEISPGEGARFLVVTDLPYPPPEHDPYTYQWYRGSDHQPIPGQTGPRLNASTSTFETYYCVVTRQCDATHSASTTSSLGYLWQRGVCDFPPLQTSQSADDIGNSDSIVFTAYDDWPDVTFQWYQGEAGDTRSPIEGDAAAPNRLTVYQPANRPRPYWVRASLTCGAHHDSATLTFRKNDCTPVLFAPQPQSPAIQSGQTFTLSADTPFVSPPVAPTAYDWFRVDATTGALMSLNHNEISYSASIAQTTRYMVRVSNKCSQNEGGSPTVDSQIATVRVASCPSITGIYWPGDISLTAGGNATVTVTADQAGGLTYAWFKGELGDESHGVGDGSSTLNTGPLSVSTNYWVRLGYGSCYADSATFHANVCVPAAAVQGQSVLHSTIYRGGSARLVCLFAGTNLTYQWYVGVKGDISHPFGISADSVRVSLINDTTKYWVSATASCGDPAQSDTFVVSVRQEITQQPVAAVDPMMPGLTTTLTAGGGLASATYQWYMGEPGDTAHPFGANALTVTTPPITGDTKFWLRISNGDTYTDSDTVTVHLCAPPEVQWAVFNTTVTSGTQYLLRIMPPDVESEIVWYQGESGDLTHSTRIGPSIFPYPGVAGTKKIWR